MARHEVALPPDFAPSAELLELQPPPGPRARDYPFELDEFQRLATTAIERGESVLVCAHTSAGKTVCAEHAIAAALRDGQRVIYSSPIKALSNQKYRELQAAFGDVGLITGDVTLNEEASCLVMTTEVLRMMLHKGSNTMREVKWVVFDEAHLLGSPDRGWVVEESLILLPHSVRYVLLSATAPNAREVAEWIAALHGAPTHVVHTDRRPTPLRHYVCARGANGLHLVQDEAGKFDEARWQAAVGRLPLPKPKREGAAPKLPRREAAAGAPGSDAALRHAREVCRVVSGFGELGMLPAIVFSFSRRECELIASEMGKHAVKGRAAPGARPGAGGEAAAEGAGGGDAGDDDGGGSGGSGGREGGEASGGEASGGLWLLGDEEVSLVEEVHRDHDLHSISATFTDGGGHFIIGLLRRAGHPLGRGRRHAAGGPASAAAALRRRGTPFGVAACTARAGGGRASPEIAVDIVSRRA